MFLAPRPGRIWVGLHGFDGRNYHHVWDHVPFDIREHVREAQSHAYARRTDCSRVALAVFIAEALNAPDESEKQCGPAIHAQAALARAAGSCRFFSHLAIEADRHVSIELDQGRSTASTLLLSCTRTGTPSMPSTTSRSRVG